MRDNNEAATSDESDEDGNNGSNAGGNNTASNLAASKSDKNVNPPHGGSSHHSFAREDFELEAFMKCKPDIPQCAYCDKAACRAICTDITKEYPLDEWGSPDWSKGEVLFNEGDLTFLCDDCEWP